MTVLSGNGCTTQSVTWSIPAGSPGSLTATGLYTAPASIAAQQTVTVTASSQTDGSTLGIATIALMPPISLSVAPSTVTLNAGQAQQLAVTVANAANTAVTWSVTGIGTVSQTGLYQAPQFINQLQTVTATATSQANPTLSASATVTLVPLITAVVNPSSATL